MKDINLLKHTMKVNKIIVIILWFFLLGSVYGVIRDPKTLEIVRFLVSFIGVFAASILVYKKAFPNTTGLIILISYMIPTLFALSNQYIAGMLAMIGLCVSALYFKKVYLIICGSFYNITIIATQLLSRSFQGWIFYATLLCIEFATVILFYLCKWGHDLIEASTKKEIAAKELLNSLDNVINVVRDNTLALNEDISGCYGRISTVKKISDTMAISVQDITKGVVEQSESINDISKMMNKADEKMWEISKTSKQLADTSAESHQIVFEGSKTINHMDKQMNIINLAVSEAVTTVQELNNSMDDINSFLSSIVSISEQTNLLALNATIEAARAGESGKGFAVVADEVRKLAEQSSRTVKQIDKIISEIKGKTQLVLKKVNSGNEAVIEGRALTTMVNEGFEKMRLSFENIDGYISKELMMTDNISSIFKQIREQSESIASISEEHSAATEEMLATVEEQNASVEDLHGLVQQISDSSIKLQELIEKS